MVGGFWAAAASTSLLAAAFGVWATTPFEEVAVENGGPSEPPERLAILPSDAITSAGGLLPQNDAESGRDADDLCIAHAPPGLQLPADASLYGELFPIDDGHDFYALPNLLNGALMELSMVPSPSVPVRSQFLPPDFDLTLHLPNCDPLDDDHQPGNLAEHIQFRVPEDGTYVAQVFIPGYAVSTSDELGTHRRTTDDDGPVRCDPPCTFHGYELILDLIAPPPP